MGRRPGSRNKPKDTPPDSLTQLGQYVEEHGITQSQLADNFVDEEPEKTILVRIGKHILVRDNISCIEKKEYTTIIHAGGSIFIVTQSPEELVEKIWGTSSVQFLEINQ